MRERKNSNEEDTEEKVDVEVDPEELENEEKYYFIIYGRDIGYKAGEI